MQSQTDPGRVFIHSFAHGRTLFDLKHDIHSATAAIEKAPKPHAIDILCEVVASAELEQDELVRLIDAGRGVSGVGVRAIAARLKADHGRREFKQRQAQSELEGFADHVHVDSLR